MIELRQYQKRTIDELYSWISENPGNPCVVLPTGAGKSVIIAALCMDALKNWPGTRILKMTHQKELIEQNADKLRKLWPNAPLGIVSASVGRKEWGQPVTFGGVQTLRGKAEYLGHIDLCLIDECHLISHNDQGTYRTLINELMAINPHMRVIGLTASPYRLGHGMITDKPAIFDGLIEPVSIIELQSKGYLAKLTSKHTAKKFDLTGVHMRGGDYIESELQAAVDTDLNNIEAVQETIKRAGDRQSWLFFCTGIDHARHIKDILIEHGITAETITGELSKSERERIIDDFKTKKIRALTNVQVLTTGFDYPDIDCIVFLRPSQSPGLYLQMAGRGLRPKTNGGDCLVLDFAGLVETHGPITAIKPPKAKGNGDGVAPSKLCPECDEIVAVQCRTCPACGYEFPIEEKPDTWKLRDDDIMGQDMIKTMPCHAWEWRVHTGKNSGKEMLAVRYYAGDMTTKPIDEYFCVWHEGFAGRKAIGQMNELLKQAGIVENITGGTDELNKIKSPIEISYVMDGKFPRIVDRKFFNDDVPF